MKTTKSKHLFIQAQTRIPGGVNSPVRAFKSVGGTPLFIKRGKGAHITDIDGNKYIDYVMSWGPLLLGHSHPKIIAEIKSQLNSGTSFGAPAEMEIKIAELIQSMMPSLELVRMVNSGTEATMSAIRVARAFTGKNKIIKFEGCYHGHGDSFLVKAGSGAMTFGMPSSPGVPEAIASLTLNAQYNDIASVEKLVAKHKKEIAAIIIEPVVGNMGVVLPKENFLKNLRALCDREKIVLIFDEVMTGFRLSAGGAQELFDVKPDMTTLGKIIGGGLPVGAYGGKKEIMQLVAPAGPVYQAGTLSGNPLAMRAGYAMLKIISQKKSLYKELDNNSTFLSETFRNIIAEFQMPMQVNQIGSMMTVFFTSDEVVDYSSAMTADTKMFGKFFTLMLNNGIYLPPAQFEAMFVSAAHREIEIAKTIGVFRKVIASMK
jgi:glutamate-1-semialdehyde 2,1-aminomutase